MGDSMTYSERDGRVILELSKEDYELLNKLMEWLTGRGESGEAYQDEIEAMLNRLNSANPSYKPYPTGGK
jgi:hypothetical protein